MKPRTITRRRHWFKTLVATTLAVLLMAVFSTPAYAWKPNTHVFLAEQAMKDAVDDGKVSIYRTDYENGQRLGKIGDYEVDAELLSALRANPQQYRAGVIGPDAYPDILTGQQVIHPDKSRPDGTNSWLEYLWNQAGTDGNNTQPIKAFVGGFLTHAAGDMYGHTFVNNFTGGPFTFIPLENAVKHVVLESYVGKRTPPIISSDNKIVTENDISIDGVDKFIYQKMIDARPGTQLDTHLLIGAGGEYSVPGIFSKLRAGLETSLVNDNWIIAGYKRHWIADIDTGLAAWPKVSQELNKALIFNSQGVDTDKAKVIANEYSSKHLLSMLGAPDFVGETKELIEGIKSLIFPIIPSFVQESLTAAIEVIQDGLLDYLVKKSFPFGVKKLKEYVEQPQNHFDLVLNSGSSGQKTILRTFNAQELKLVDTGYSNPNETFDYQKVPAAYNTVTMSKLLLLNQSGMNRLLRDLGSSLSLTEPNAMLGFIRTLDGDNQWHINPQKMILAQDCNAYRKVFMRQTGEEGGCAVPVPEPSISYSITELGSLGGSGSSASGINKFGQVAGTSRTSTGAQRPFLWQNGVMKDLGTLGGAGSFHSASAINDAGQVVGTSNSHAFLYRRGMMQDLGTLGGTYSEGHGINNSGQVVGLSYPTSGPVHAFLWENDVMKDLGTLGGNLSVADAINNSGQVVGISSTTSRAQHAFLWENDVMKDLGTLGGNVSAAEAINNSGQVVGQSRLTDDGETSIYHAFLWENSVMKDLGTLSSDSDNSTSVAWGINDSGQVVGDSSVTGNQNEHAFLYSNGVMKDLNTLIPRNSGWELTSAYSINDAGQIVGQGVINGRDTAFLATPITLVPTISSFTPIKGKGGTQVVIKGTNFSSTQSVSFNKNAATFRVDSATQITATAPQGVTTGPISVKTLGGVAISEDLFFAGIQPEPEPQPGPGPQPVPGPQPPIGPV